jgi:ABC-type microcin C transport system permease subunit YejE
VEAATVMGVRDVRILEPDFAPNVILNITIYTPYAESVDIVFLEVRIQTTLLIWDKLL